MILFANEIIDSAGGIQASYVFGLLVLIVGFFIVKNLNSYTAVLKKIEKRLDDQETQSQLHTNVLLQMLTRLGNDDDFFEGLTKQLNKN